MNFWAVLGLAPGQDAAAVKKAYAARLRVTRPDDDAAAYQQLREAFDAAMAHVKSAPRPAGGQAGSPPGAAPPAPVWDTPARSSAAQDLNTPAAEQVLPPAQTAPPDPILPDQAPQAEDTRYADEEADPAWPNATAQPQAAAIDIAGLVDDTLDLWEKQGDAALLAYWPQLKKTLHESALGQALAGSTAFARMVLRQPQLAPEFVNHLRLFFGWGSDYKRAPELSGHDVIQFKRRLAHVADTLAQDSRRAAQAQRDQEEQRAKQLRQKAHKEEQERRKAALAAEQASAAARQRAAAVHSQYPHLLPFARMMAAAGPKSGILYALLKGPGLAMQWRDLTREERAALGIEDETYFNGVDTCKEAMGLRARLGLGVLALAPGVLGAYGDPPFYLALALAGLLLSFLFPVYHWQEGVRQALSPQRLAARWIRVEQIDIRHVRLAGLYVSTAALLLSLMLTAPLSSADARYPAGQACAAIVLLACQWLLPPQQSDDSRGAFIPVLILCVTACRAAGVTDLLTQLSLSAFWFAAAHAALNNYMSRRRLLAIWAGALVIVSAYPQVGGMAPAFVPLGVVAPFVLLLLSRRQTTAFVVATIAIGILAQTAAPDGKLAYGVAGLAIIGGCGAALMRRSADWMAARFLKERAGA